MPTKQRMGEKTRESEIVHRYEWMIVGKRHTTVKIDKMIPENKNLPLDLAKNQPQQRRRRQLINEKEFK